MKTTLSNSVSEVSTFRLYLLRAMYAFMFVGLALTKMARDPQPLAGHIERGHRRRERAGRDLAPGAIGNPPSAQDAAIAVLRAAVEGAMGSDVGPPPLVFPAAGSGQRTNADLRSGGRCSGATCRPLGLRLQAVREGTWKSLG